MQERVYGVFCSSKEFALILPFLCGVFFSPFSAVKKTWCRGTLTEGSRVLRQASNTDKLIEEILDLCQY